eukprot:TRINITY_DN7383_c0_g1_i1.p1 TRINITY_DN7383_c0_g1~~TRINITY_DN7383_c0_g1_i1.p1  ORF type:complete len:801 (-),score=252.43 TRINITY_DN7383_c0_g1_i1:48-2450(-)
MWGSLSSIGTNLAQMANDALADAPEDTHNGHHHEEEDGSDSVHAFDTGPTTQRSSPATPSRLVNRHNASPPRTPTTRSSSGGATTPYKPKPFAPTHNASTYANGTGKPVELSDLEERHKEEIAALQRKQQEQLKHLSVSHQEDLTFMQGQSNEYQQRIQALEGQLAAEKKRAHDLTGSLKLARSQSNASSTTASAAAASIAAASKEKEALAQRVKVLENEMEALRNNSAQAQSALKQEKEAADKKAQDLSHEIDQLRQQELRATAERERIEQQSLNQRKEMESELVQLRKEKEQQQTTLASVSSSEISSVNDELRAELQLLREREKQWNQQSHEAERNSQQQVAALERALAEMREREKLLISSNEQQVQKLKQELEADAAARQQKPTTSTHAPQLPSGDHEKTIMLERKLEEMKEKEKVWQQQMTALSEQQLEGQDSWQEKIEALEEQLKTTSLLAESLQAQLAEANEKADKLSKDATRLRGHLIEKEDVHNLELLESEKRYEQLAKKMGDHEKKQTAMSAAVMKYDKLLAEYKEKEIECEQNAVAVMNLQNILEQVQTERDDHTRYELVKLNKDLAQARDQILVLNDKLAASEKTEQRCREAEELVQRLHETLNMKTREMIKLQEEVDPLRRGLEESLRRLQNATDNGKNLVDKRLVSKLFVTYLSRSNQREVLGIMSNVLDWTEEEQIQVGLKQSARKSSWLFGFGGARDSLPPGVTPASSSSPSGGESDKTLTDLWVEFLLKEAHAAEAAATSSTTTTTTPTTTASSTTATPTTSATTITPPPTINTIPPTTQPTPL